MSLTGGSDISLPTDASTATLQTAGNSSLSSIDGKVPALGQAAMAASTPVVIANNQSAVPVSGTVTVALPVGAATEATLAKLTQTQGSITTGQSGPLVQGAVTTAAPTYTTAQTSPISLTTTGLLRVDNSGVTQPVSGTVTANAGTNLNTSLLALEAGGNLASIKTNTDNLNLAQASTTSGQKGNLSLGAVTTAAPTYTTAQTNPLSLTTAGALRTDASATTQPVSGTVAATQSGTWTVQPGNTANTTAWKVDGSAVTQPVSGTVTANQGGAPWSENITQFGGTNISTGTGASGTGIPRVTVANDSNILATQSGTWNIGTVTPGTAATNLGKAEDAAHTTGDVGVFALGVRNDANASFTNTDLDYSPIATDIAGRLKVVQESSVKTTYAAAIVNLATAATATDVFTIAGSASKTIKIIEIGISGSATAISVPISLIKRSAANTGGTSTAPTVVPFDSNNAAGTAVVTAYTANPSALGAAVGTIKTHRLFIDTTTITSNFLLWQHGATPSQPIVLRGTAQVLAINLNSTTVSAAALSFYVVWTEE